MSSSQHPRRVFQRCRWTATVSRPRVLGECGSRSRQSIYSRYQVQRNGTRGTRQGVRGSSGPDSYWQAGSRSIAQSLFSCRPWNGTASKPFSECSLCLCFSVSVRRAFCRGKYGAHHIWQDWAGMTALWSIPVRGEFRRRICRSHPVASIPLRSGTMYFPWLHRSSVCSLCFYIRLVAYWWGIETWVGQKARVGLHGPDGLCYIHKYLNCFFGLFLAKNIFFMFPSYEPTCINRGP